MFKTISRLFINAHSITQQRVNDDVGDGDLPATRGFKWGGLLLSLADALSALFLFESSVALLPMYCLLNSIGMLTSAPTVPYLVVDLDPSPPRSELAFSD